MNWEPVTFPSLSHVLESLEGREWSCEHLVTRLLQKKKTHTIEPDQIWMTQEGGEIAGLLFWGKSGLLLPYFPFLNRGEEEKKEYFTSLRNHLLENHLPIHSIVGIRSYVQALSEILQLEGGLQVEYYLMTREKEEPLPLIPEVPGFRTRPASLKDIEKILPLQILYEKEEVLLQPEYVDPGKTRKELESTLKEQIVLMGEYRGVPVAKVGTNARGIRYDQIGGVFTDLPYRGRHFARYLMIELLKTLKHQKKSACLFVKNKNAAALHLYEALQFKYREPFRIHYF